jgi:hypothetical protein
VVLAIVFLIRREVRDSEIGAQVDHAFAARHECLGVRRRRPVGEREEEEVDVARRQRRGVGIGEFQAPIRAPHGRNHGRERLARLAAGRHGRQRYPRMSEEEFDQDFARVTGRANDADFHSESGSTTGGRLSS